MLTWCKLLASMKVVLVFIVSNLMLQLPSVISQCSDLCTCPSTTATCCFLIKENRPPGTEVGVYNGTTGPFMWSSDTNNMFFSINSSGFITTKVELDREGTYERNVVTGGVQSFKENGYCFNLVIEGSNIERVDIQVVDVNDNPPIFGAQSYNVTVLESSGDSLVPSSCDSYPPSIVATDGDEGTNAEIIYMVEGSDQFILPFNNSPCVQGRGLDRDNPPSTYSFTLVAQDAANSSLKSTTNVTFILQDINDNAPFFVNETATVYVDENKKPGDVVYTFEACDIDSGINGKEGIIYSIDPVGTFMINELNGTVTLAKPIDAELQDTYELTVTAEDSNGGGSELSRTSMPITFLVNDVNEPGVVEIIGSNLNVVENTSMNSSLLIASFALRDSDETVENRLNGNFTLTSSDPGNFYMKLIMVRGNTFFFSLLLNGTLDREKNSIITLFVNLTEGGNPTLYISKTFTVTVLDINDNGPVLNKTAFNVTEKVDVQIDLSNYTYDNDNGINGTVANYRLISAHGIRNLDLTENFKNFLSPNGELRIPAADIDREAVGDSVFFLVNITDAGDPPESNVNEFTLTVMDINDNSPEFDSLSYTFSVPENSPVGTMVGQVQAFDPDLGRGGHVVYTLSPQFKNFTVNNMTGLLRTEKVFDLESINSNSLLTITATDGDGNASSVPVIILIDDVNDNDPVFVKEEDMFKIAVTKRVGELVGQVMAIDVDSTMENRVIVYQIEEFNTFFAIPHNTSGNITLKIPLIEPGTFTFNVSAFNPGRDENKSVITITVVVDPEGLNMTLIVVVSATGAFFSILIIVVVLLLVFIILKNRKSKQQLKLHEEEERLNNAQVSILKIPAAVNGTAGKSSRVTFKERVEETHYDGESSVINSTTSTIKKESVTKFDGSSQVLCEDDCVALSPTSPSPVSSNGKPSQLSSSIAVVELEMSPRQVMNGDINGRCQFDVLSHSPILRIPNAAGARGHTAEMLEYSQGTSSDGHVSAHDMDDESMYSDDASIVVTALSRFGSSRPGMGISSYETTSSHPHMELHRHLPPISHGQHTHSSSLAQLHAYNLAQLAKSNSTESRPRYSPMLSPDQELTPTDDTIHHTTISTQSSIHTPTAPMNHMGMSSKHQHLNGRQNFSHPLVMPDAFPLDPPDVHRFPMGSFADYGEASTYASTELDEALGFNEMEPGIISLTATDYDDDTQL